MGSLGWPEIIIILIVALLLFGAKRLPEVGKSLGKAIREFKKSFREISDDMENEDYEEGEKKDG